MKRKLVLEIEELEERIAPHAPLGGGHSEVRIHSGNELLLPNGNVVNLPEAALDGIARSVQGGN